jgi:hypothetical protein
MVVNFNFVKAASFWAFIQVFANKQIVHLDLLPYMNNIMSISSGITGFTHIRTTVQYNNTVTLLE